MRIKLITSLLVALYVQVPASAAEIDDLIERLGIRESELPSREMAGWAEPSKVTVLVPDNMQTSGVGSEVWFQQAASGVEIEFVVWGDTPATDSEAWFGWCSPSAVAAMQDLRYMHIYSAGMDRCMTIPGISESEIIATNSQKSSSETIAEHSIALMLMLTRNLHNYHNAVLRAQWSDDIDGPPTVSVMGKTMLVLGLGGIGSQTARRANDLGMRVIGTRNSSRSGPDYVDYVGLSDEMGELARRANVVVNALPLTETTRGIVDAEFFGNLPDNSYYVSVGRGATTDTDALISALESGRLAGAGLDVTDPEPLPADHRLWSMPNVIITPHMAGTSDISASNRLLIARENLRRYVAGDKLLNLVDLSRGY